MGARVTALAGVISTRFSQRATL